MGGAMSASELAAVMAATVGIAVGIIMDARGNMCSLIVEVSISALRKQTLLGP